MVSSEGACAAYYRYRNNGTTHDHQRLKQTKNILEDLQCPIPLQEYPQSASGSRGRRSPDAPTHRQNVSGTAFDNPTYSTF